MTTAYVRPYGLSGQWKVVRMDCWGRGKQRFFWREIAWRNVAQLYRATSFEKEISKQLSRKIFQQSLYNFLLQLTKAIMSTNNSREIVACRRQVLSREQESTRVKQAKTIAKRARQKQKNKTKFWRRKSASRKSQGERKDRKLTSHLISTLYILLLFYLRD